jgi:hypothetical protein
LDNNYFKNFHFSDFLVWVFEARIFFTTKHDKKINFRLFWIQQVQIVIPVKNKGLSEPEIRQFWGETVMSDTMLHGVRAFLRISVRLRICHGNLHVSDCEVLRTKIRGKIRVGLKISHVLLKFSFKFCHRQLILTRLSNEIYINKEWGKFQINISKILSISEPFWDE